MSQWLDLIQKLAHYHLPEARIAIPLWGAAGTLLVGITLWLVGARLIHGAVILAFVTAGAAIGARGAEHFGFSIIVGILVGALVCGVAGVLLFRMWVAFLTAIVAAAVACAITAGPRLPELFDDFSGSPSALGMRGTDGYAPPSPEAQAANRDGDPVLVVQRFATYAWEHEPQLCRRALVAGGASMLIGMLIGIWAYGWSLALGAGLGGTLLAASGAMSLGGRYWPSGVQWLMDRPTYFAAGLGVLGLWGVWRNRPRRRALPLAPAAPEAGG